MSKQRRRDTENNRSKTQQFFAQLIAKLRDWLNRTGSPLRLSRRFVRSLLSQSRTRVPRARGQRGFVLPVTVMVTTVVTLLVVVMVGRATQRATSAANARVEQAFKNSATPIVDRARAKIERLLNDNNLPQGLPSDSDLANALDGGAYTFADEIRLQTVADLNGVNSIEVGNGFGPDQGNEEILNSVWRFPIDTDGNGLFDSFGLYSIQFRSPALARQNNRPVSVLESRTPPMDESANSNICAQAAAAGTRAVGGGWESSGNRLKKSFFVFAATIPITADPSSLVTGTFTNPSAAFDPTRYEVLQGNSSLSALELQQDRARTPLNNNAVWFESDLEVARPAPFRLNGRVFTNSNLMIGANNPGEIEIYQVSDPRSCYYEEDNAKVLVAGNVLNGDALTPDTTSLAGADFHLFQGAGIDPTVSGIVSFTGSDQTVTEPGENAAFNDDAYNRRIDMMITAAFECGARWTCNASNEPLEPTQNYDLDPDTLPNNYLNPGAFPVLKSVAAILDETPSLTIPEAYRIHYNRYFRNRTRKVPFKEVGFGTGVINPTDVFRCGGSTCTVANVLSQAPNDINDFLSPPLAWILPPAQGGAFGAYDAVEGAGLPIDGTEGLALNGSGTVNLPATELTVQNTAGVETFLGDRIIAGNNLPGQWYRLDGNGDPEFVGGTGTSGAKNFIGNPRTGVAWDDFGAIPELEDRYRTTQIDTLADLGSADRNGFWETSAADDPSAGPGETTNTNPQDYPVTGGLRVVTSAGIYNSNVNQSFLPVPPPVQDNPITTDINESVFRVVWPDTMPMTGAVRWDGSAWRPFLLFNQNGTILTEDLDGDGVLAPGEDINNNGRLDRQGRWAASSDSGAILLANNAINDSANGDTRNGHFKMRATAVYHYKNSAYDPNPSTSGNYQTPIACVSSYYDNSTPETVQNVLGLPPYDGNDPGPGSSAQGRSNNGISYPPPTTTAADIAGVTAPDANGLFPVGFAPGNGGPRDELYFQANMVFPNGRLVNEPLYRALVNIANGVDLSLADQSAIDSTLCAIEIFDGTLSPSNAVVPHGTFKEAAFLDGREIKSANRHEALADLDAVNYDLEIEQRQPMEIRVTDIDMNLLRGTTIAGTNNSGVTAEYLLPYSGIVYASRDDALKDLSDVSSTNLATRETISPTDFKLDPTRRPSGIRLIDGQRLWRGTGTSQPTVAPGTEGEKGLIMVTNLPLYVKGDFNLHTQEEFNVALASDWGNFYTPQ
jgi:hypothetical protein